MKCSLCDNEISSGSNFCSRCGTPVNSSRNNMLWLSTVKFCDQCGKELLVGDNFQERATVLTKLGQISHRNLEYQEAIRYFSEAITLRPTGDAAYTARSIVWEKRGEYRKVIDDLDVVVLLNPQDYVAFRRRGNAYLVLGHYKKAIKNFEKAIQICHQDAISFRRKGLAHFELGDYVEAIHSLTQAITLDPNDPWTYYWRSQTFGTLGQSDASQSDINRHNSLLINKSGLF